MIPSKMFWRGGYVWPVFLLVGVVTLFVQVLWANHSGLGFDEAYSIAVPYRFVLGDRPFVDEVILAQSFSLLTTPLIWSYYKITGSTAGIVLFMRLICVFSVGLVAALAFLLVNTVFDKKNAALCSMIFVCLACPSFDFLFCHSIGILFVTTAMFLLHGRLGGAPVKISFVSGCMIGFGIIAHPSIVAVAMYYAVIIAFFTPLSKRWLSIGNFLLGTMTVPCVLVLLYHVPLSGIYHSYLNTKAFCAVAYSNAYQWHRGISAPLQFIKHSPFHWPSLVACGLFYLLVKRGYRWPVAVLSMFLIVWVYFFVARSPIGGMGWAGILLPWSTRAFASPFGAKIKNGQIGILFGMASITYNSNCLLTYIELSNHALPPWANSRLHRFCNAPVSNRARSF